MEIDLGIVNYVQVRCLFEFNAPTSVRVRVGHVPGRAVPWTKAFLVFSVDMWMEE